MSGLLLDTHVLSSGFLIPRAYHKLHMRLFLTAVSHSM